MRKPYKEEGFTLAELMIALGTMCIMIVVAASTATMFTKSSQDALIKNIGASIQKQVSAHLVKHPETRMDWRFSYDGDLPEDFNSDNDLDKIVEELSYDKKDETKIQILRGIKDDRPGIAGSYVIFIETREEGNVPTYGVYDPKTGEVTMSDQNQLQETE